MSLPAHDQDKGRQAKDYDADETGSDDGGHFFENPFYLLPIIGGFLHYHRM
jgi:hypothetical protein